LGTSSSDEAVRHHHDGVVGALDAPEFSDPKILCVLCVLCGSSLLAAGR
jgi:hypothetical protein